MEIELITYNISFDILYVNSISNDILYNYFVNYTDYLYFLVLCPFNHLLQHPITHRPVELLPAFDAEPVGITQDHPPDPDQLNILDVDKVPYKSLAIRTGQFTTGDQLIHCFLPLIFRCVLLLLISPASARGSGMLPGFSDPGKDRSPPYTR